MTTPTGPDLQPDDLGGCRGIALAVAIVLACLAALALALAGQR